ERARGRVVTAAVKEMSFAKPMKVGDTLCVYTHVDRVGRTSMVLKVEAWAQRYLSDLMEKVTHADFVMVALDKNGKPTPVPPEAGGRQAAIEESTRLRASLMRPMLVIAHSASALTGISSSRPRSVNS